MTLELGAGPAGLAAAAALAGRGVPVALVDRHEAPGGQIGRQRVGSHAWSGRYAPAIRNVLGHRLVTWRGRTSVLAVRAVAGGFEVLVDAAGHLDVREGSGIVLAGGAREVVAPFPGWDLPGVVASGGLQALLKRHGRAPGSQIGIAGSGPLLLAVAAAVRDAGVVPAFHLERRRPGAFVRLGTPVAARAPASGHRGSGGGSLPRMATIASAPRRSRRSTRPGPARSPSTCSPSATG